jgi:hypothetical protein
LARRLVLAPRRAPPAPAGHEVFTPTLTGLGERAHLAGVLRHHGLDGRRVGAPTLRRPADRDVWTAHRAHGRWQSIPRKGYILAERFANSRFGVFAERVRNTPGWQYSGIAAGHDVMVDKPQQLADILVDLGHA